MTTKEYLGQARKFQKEIDAIRQQILVLRTIAEKATATLKPVCVRESGYTGRYEDTLIALVDLTDVFDTRMRGYIKAVAEISDTIDSVERSEYRALLRYYYIAGMTWEQVADAMNYSFRNIHYLHDKALDAVCVILQNKKAV